MFLILLSACTSANNQILTQTPTQTLTSTPTTTLTPTPIPLANLEGVLFFDYNGSGLLEENEPPIVSFKVCVKAKDICVDTDENGHFIFENIASQGTEILLSFVDPNANKPVLAFRYINHWKSEVVIQAYEMDGIQIPEQHLNDTEVIPLANGISTKAGNDDKIGLMQGFLTHPLQPEAIANLHHILGFDHDPRKGFVANYAGDLYRCPDSPYCNPIDPTKLKTNIPLFAGVYDSHVGYDFMFPREKDKYYFLASMPGIIDISIGNYGTVVFIEGSDLGFEFGPLVTNGEIYKAVVQKGEKVYRGQIIGLTGEAEYKAEHPEYRNTVALCANYEMTLLLGPQNPPEPDDYKPNSYEKDPFGVTDPNIPMNFPELEVYSSWTVFNSPQQPLVKWGEK
jgi:hypothetical protein